MTASAASLTNLKALLPQPYECSYHLRNRTLAPLPSDSRSTPTYVHTTARILPTSGIILGFLLSRAPEAGDFGELILLYSVSDASNEHSVSIFKCLEGREEYPGRAGQKKEIFWYSLVVYIA